MAKGPDLGRIGKGVVGCGRAVNVKAQDLAAAILKHLCRVTQLPVTAGQIEVAVGTKGDHRAGMTVAAHGCGAPDRPEIGQLPCGKVQLAPPKVQGTPIGPIDPGQIDQTGRFEIRREGHVVKADLPVIRYHRHTGNRLDGTRGGHMDKPPCLFGHQKSALGQDCHGPGPIKACNGLDPKRRFGNGKGG